MKHIPTSACPTCRRSTAAPEGQLWELVMGQQVHIGGFRSSMDLAERAGIGAGMSGVDLCCCTGAGMRFLVRFRNVARMHGVDATPAVVEQGRRRCAAEGLGRPDHLHAGRRLPTRACPRRSSISSGARTPGATWSTSRR